MPACVGWATGPSTCSWAPRTTCSDQSLTGPGPSGSPPPLSCSTCLRACSTLACQLALSWSCGIICCRCWWSLLLLLSRVDLLLAMQAPLRLERMVPQIASLGVDRLFITGGNKVVTSYWGSHLLRKPVRATTTTGWSGGC